MKVYLINPPHHSVFYSKTNLLGLLFITQYLIDNGINARFIDMGCYRDTPESIPLDGDVYGIGLFTPQHGFGVDLITKLKGYNKKVIVGNIHASSFAELLLRVGADVVVHGEGEQAMLDILTKPLDDVEGISYLQENTLVNTKPRVLESNIDRFAFPRVKDLGVAPYQARSGMVPILEPGVVLYPVLGSRGCPWACAFCGSLSLWKRTVRRHSIEYMKEWLTYICDNGCNYIWFNDATFVTNKAWTLAMCGILKDLNKPWRFGTRADTLDEELIKCMANSGCVHVGVGSETGSQKLLDKMHKEETIEEIGQTLDLLHKYNIETSTCFMYGFPGETQEDIDKTTEFIKKHKPTLIGISAFIPFPGCDVFNKPEKYNFSLDPKWDFNKYRWTLNEDTIPLFVPEDRIQDTIKFGQQLRSAIRDSSILIEDRIPDPEKGWNEAWKNLS